jgi:hypothetical protein
MLVQPGPTRYSRQYAPEPGPATQKDRLYYARRFENSTIIRTYPYRFGGEWAAGFYYPLEQLDRLVRPMTWQPHVPVGFPFYR